MAGENRLTVRALVLGAWRDRPRLDVELEFGPGITAVIGASGAGKSTLLSSIAGLLQPDAGGVVLNGEVLFDSARRVSLAPHRRRVALVFQSLALFPHLTAWENVAYGVRGRARAGRRTHALRWLSRTRVEHVADRLPEALSGGEAQRVALARALASEPRALLLDEPFSALDAALRTQLGAELRSWIETLAIPTVLVTHDRHDALNLGSRVVTLEAGRESRQTQPDAKPRISSVTSSSPMRA